MDFLNAAQPDDGSLVLDYLEHEFVGYPFDLNKDKIFVNLLLKEFDSATIFNELKIFHIWTLDAQPKQSSYRVILRKWLSKIR
jgi:hypothetical protein